MRLSNFPIPYPDELFYSLMARYSNWLRYPNRKVLLREAFGSDTITASFEFPSLLGCFISRLPVGHPCARTDLVNSCTLFPWYEPFLPPERTHRLWQAIMGQGGMRSSGLVGLLPSRVQLPAALRFCPECFKNDWRKGWELYWRRLHQMPGIEACPEHAIKLEESSVRRADRVNRQDFLLPNADFRCMCCRREAPDGPKMRLAKLGEALLAKRWKPVGLNNLQANLLVLLADLGYVTLNQRVRTAKLQDAMNQFYGAAFLSRLGGDHWIERIVRTPRHAHAPIRYLAVLGFLNAGLDQLLACRIKPSVPKVLLCRNLICPNRGKATAFLKSVKSKDHVGEVSLYQCEKCGRVMARCPTANEQEWIRSYGALWLKQLAKLWNTPDESLRGIARLLDADPITIKRQAFKAGLRFPRESIRATTTRGLKLSIDKGTDPIPKWRARWLRAKRENSGMGAKALRRRFPALYMALYRRDRVWLLAQHATRTRKVPERFSADWKLRDEALRRKLPGVARQLRMVARPQRITGKGLLRAAGAQSWESKLVKLPKSRSLLKRLAEGRVAFACRRVRHVACLNLAGARQAKAWQVQRHAGLRPELVRDLVLSRVFQSSMRQLYLAAEMRR